MVSLAIAADVWRNSEKLMERASGSGRCGIGDCEARRERTPVSAAIVLPRRMESILMSHPPKSSNRMHRALPHRSNLCLRARVVTHVAPDSCGDLMITLTIRQMQSPLEPPRKPIGKAVFGSATPFVSVIDRGGYRELMITVSIANKAARARCTPSIVEGEQ
jgi:hypothetical protein